LLDAIELALDASGRSLRILVGDTPRCSTPVAQLSMLPLATALRPGDDVPSARLHVALSFEFVVSVCGFGCRPRLRVDEASSTTDTGGALRPMRTLVTFEAVYDIGLELVSDREVDDSATVGETVGAEEVGLFAARSELPFPKLSFHFDTFLTTTGRTSGTGIGASDLRERMEAELGESRVCDLEARLSSRAKVCDAEANISDVMSRSNAVACWTPFLRAPRLRRLVVECEREADGSPASPSCSSVSSTS